MHISTEQKAFVHVSQGDAHSCPEAKVMLRTPSCPPQRSLAHAAAGLAEADSWNGRDSSELRTARSANRSDHAYLLYDLPRVGS